MRGKILSLTSTSWEAEATILGIGTRNGKMTMKSGAAFLAILQGEVPQTTHHQSRLTAEKKGHHCRYGPPVRNICELIRGAQCGDFLQNHVYTPCGWPGSDTVIADGLNVRCQYDLLQHGDYRHRPGTTRRGPVTCVRGFSDWDTVLTCVNTLAATAKTYVRCRMD